MVQTFFTVAFAFFSLPFTLAHPAALTEPVDPRFGCFAEPPAEFLNEVAKLVSNNDTGFNSPIADNSTPQKADQTTSAPMTTITVKIFFHVVAASMAATDGYLSDTNLLNQLGVLNTDYAPHNIRFINGGIDRTINPTWANDTQGTEILMKKQLRRGDYKALNLYYLKSLRQGSFGYCSFPGRIVQGSDPFILDGCSQRFDTVPGGSLRNFNKGKTTVHEVGHWFGLFHTFQGGCTGNGDLIADTPASISPTHGCPVGRDSCPDQEGLDPIHNYMDYSFDTCYNNFTPLQGARMHDMFQMYRATG